MLRVPGLGCRAFGLPSGILSLSFQAKVRSLCWFSYEAVLTSDSYTDPMRRLITTCPLHRLEGHRTVNFVPHQPMRGRKHHWD